MGNDIIKYVRTEMSQRDKQVEATNLLKGLTGDGWALEVLEVVYGKENRENMGKLQTMKRHMLDLLVAKFEGEKSEGGN